MDNTTFAYLAAATKSAMKTRDINALGRIANLCPASVKRAFDDVFFLPSRSWGTTNYWQSWDALAFALIGFGLLEIAA